jgi:hypothetical protein
VGASWDTSDLYFFSYDAANNHISASVKEFAMFLKSVYPTPPKSIFEYPLNELDWTDESLKLKNVKIRDNPGTYSRLKLVGHSLGAVVLRSLVLEHARAQLANRAATAPAANASLFLFAPAHGGFQPSGRMGLVYNALREFAMARVIFAALAKYRAFEDLQVESPMLRELRKETECLSKDHPEIESLSARIAWGKLEQVVRVSKYACDLLENEQHFPDKGHLGICKATSDFTFPLLFVSDKEGKGQYAQHS